MLTYWLLFITFAWAAIVNMRPAGDAHGPRPANLAWASVGLLLSILIGFRHEVGGDWFSYLDHIEQIKGVPFREFADQKDPAYALLNWIAANVGGGIYFVNSVAAIVFSWGLIAFCREQPRPWLALTVSMPYLITVVAMGYTRQGVAIGLIMLGLASLNRGGTGRFLFWVAIATLFHKSAIVMAPMAIFASTRRPIFSGLGVLLIAPLLYISLLQDSIDALVVNYIEAEYQSAGAAIRVSMNALPAVLFLLLRDRMRLTQEAQRFWTWMAFGALVFVALLMVSPSSTAVDRVALYWIPLQLFVLNRIPDALGQFGKRNPVLVTLVLAYSAAVLFVWLFFAAHAFAWIPYRSYLLQWM
jgi:hypothetical protein